MGRLYLQQKRHELKTKPQCQVEVVQIYDALDMMTTCLFSFNIIILKTNLILWRKLNNSYWSKNMLNDTLQKFFSTYFAVEKNSLFCRTKIYFVEEMFICVQRSKHYWIRRQSQHAVRTLIIQGKEINCETKRKILPYK